MLEAALNQLVKRITRGKEGLFSVALTARSPCHDNAALLQCGSLRQIRNNSLRVEQHISDRFVLTDLAVNGRLQMQVSRILHQPPCNEARPHGRVRIKTL